MLKKSLLLLLFAFLYMTSNAQQYNIVIINGSTNDQTQQESKWYTIDTNSSERYPVWKTFFSNGEVVFGRGEYLNEYLVNIDTNNSERYPVWKVYNMSGVLVSWGKGYVAPNGLIVIDTNNSERYPVWETYTPEGRFISKGRP